MAKSNQEGFTLIEVMIAMLVLTVGSLGVISMHYFSINGNVFSRNLTHVTFAAAGEIERIMDLDYDDALLDDGTVTYNLDDGAIEASVSYTVTDDDPTLPGLKLITITVFSDTGGEDTTITYSYIKAPMG